MIDKSVVSLQDETTAMILSAFLIITLIQIIKSYVRKRNENKNNR